MSSAADDKNGDPDLWRAWMRQAQAGDATAYRALLRAVTPYVRAAGLRALGDAHAAEDLVQDVLLTVHAVRHTYDPARPFRPWLIGIMRHRIADAVRVRGRRRAREEALTEAHETFPASAANEEAGTWDQPALHAALLTLPPGQRQAVELLKLKEMSLKQASEATGLSITALKVAVHRGVAALRRRLSGDAS